MRLAADRTDKALPQEPSTQIDNTQGYVLFMFVLWLFLRDTLIGPVCISLQLTISGSDVHSSKTLDLGVLL